MPYMQMQDFFILNYQENKLKSFGHFYDDFTAEERKQILTHFNLDRHLSSDISFNKLPFIKTHEILISLMFGDTGDKKLSKKLNKILRWKGAVTNG